MQSEQGRTKCRVCRLQHNSIQHLEETKQRPISIVNSSHSSCHGDSCETPRHNTLVFYSTNSNLFPHSQRSSWIKMMWRHLETCWDAKCVEDSTEDELKDLGRLLRLLLASLYRSKDNSVHQCTSSGTTVWLVIYFKPMLWFHLFRFRIALADSRWIQIGSSSFSHWS